MHPLALLIVGTCSLSALSQDNARWTARLRAAFDDLTAGRAQEAGAIFDEVAVAAGAAGDDRSLAEARRGQGRVLATRADAAGMQAAYADALRLFEIAGDARGIGQVRTDLGFAAWQRSDFVDSRGQYTLAVAAFEKAGLRSEQANALRNMTFGDMSRADRIETLERALPIAREGTDPRVEGLIFHALGDALSSAGHQQRALEQYEAALPLLEVRNDAALARLLTSFGRLHRLHGDPERSLGYYDRALELAKRTRDRDGERQAEDAITVALWWLDRPQEAMAHAERALKIAEESRPTLAAAQRLRVGEIAVRLGDTDRALALFLPEQVGASAVVARLAGLANVLTIRRDFDAALIHANAAVAGARVSDWESTILAYGARSRVQEDAGRLPEATADAVLAVAVLDGVRGGLVVDDGFRAAFSGGYRYYFDRAVELLARSGRHRDAFDIAERGRARALLDLKLARAGSPVAITDTGRDDGGVGDNSPLPAIGPDDTLVAYWVARDATYTWVLNAGSIVRFERLAIVRRDLERLVSKAGAGAGDADAKTARATRGGPLSVFDQDPRPTLRLLHDRILGPLRPTLPKRRGARLLIVPDGPLLGLSFAELLARDGRYVLEDYTLQYAPSVALLKRAARRAAVTEPDTSALLVSVSAGYPRIIGETLSPLPGARREVDALVPLFSRTATTHLTEGEATEARIRAALGGQTVVHFATHAITSSREPAESFLAFRAGGGHDGRLTAGEILGMSLDAELVVLSACHGASGQVAGEGMLGLSRALLAAGARAVLASVRELPDEAAADMLPRFYAAWRLSGDAAGALRSAQLEQLRRLRAGRVRVTTPFGPVTLSEHPSLWAGFVLIGQR